MTDRYIETTDGYRYRVDHIFLLTDWRILFLDEIGDVHELVRELFSLDQWNKIRSL